MKVSGAGFPTSEGSADRPKTRPSVTAVVCTRDRPLQLRRALESLQSQSLMALDLLVVDSGPSDDATRTLVANEFPAACYVRERAAGLDFARNRALRESTTDLVAFLDDDAVADRDWAASLAGVFERQPRIAACTGRVDPMALETPAQRLFEANGGFSRGDRPILLPRDSGLPLQGRRAPLIAWAVSIGSGCSLALRREAALAVGAFDEALDLSPLLPGGGDHDMLWRLLEAGYQIAYEPTARARHEHRRDMKAVIDQIVGHQRGLLAFLLKAAASAGPKERMSVFAFLGWRLFKPAVRLARRLAGADPLPAWVLLRMAGNSWLGMPAYFMARRAARQRLLAARGAL